MQLLRRLTDGDGHPLTRRLRALWGGDRPRLRAVDGGHAATPWGESHVPGHYWGEWTAESLRAAQMVWGHSLLGPCSPDELSLLAAWVKPRRGTRIALLGAGLGGFGLALSRICHCHVTGFEQADVLLRLCPDRRNGHLRSLDSITVKTEHSFDHVVIDGLGHRAGDIAPFLKPAAALASPRGWMIVRGYCVTDGAIRDGERHRRWVETEPARPRVPTRAELLRQVERIGFEIIDEADTADQHSAAIDACWAPAVDLIRLVSAKKRQRTLIPHLIEEADRWRERVEMIKAGDLAVVELLTKRASS
ncbi:hypothetical protein BSL82_04020 [Tardibacter chloracetimidivorans]|uniref:Methyltransferase type 11 domain-containing protein n=1 Tax=Tardibacter chloracetimidivorans TaxID=1921510 RepID=A0A1L3ZSG9_9SPHN|nr:hypothetical protein [Tardibacter chloracetimidivorans]API58582.1 hypothetical protein BSL82_04020 [Tardibacter chloracetimidivorans]